ncbi:MAG TPA: ABC transporter substrate-binding protein [bacterium]|nr:ABC transporter substrate-binding protein [bacterium]
MSARILAALATAAMLMAVIPVQAQGPVTITWSTLATGGPAVSDVYRALVAEFERQNPGIKVELQVLPGTSGEQYNRYVTLFAAKDPSVDVISIDVIWPAPMVAAGWLAPLDRWFTSAAREGFLPGAIRANTIGGKIYGVPWYTDAGLLYYRKDLLAKYGAKIPASWDEMVATAQKVTAGEHNPQLAGFLFQGAKIEALADFFFEVLWSHGGDVLDPTGKVVVDSARGSAAMNFILDLVRKDHVTPPGVATMTTDDTRVAFQDGRAVFLRNWTYAYDLFQSSGSKVAGLVGIAPLPKGPAGRSASTLGGWQLAISNFSRNKEAAWRFVEFMTGGIAEKSMALQLSTVPTRTDTFRDPEVKAHAPQSLDMLRAVLGASPRPRIPDYPRMSAIIQSNLQAALTSQTSGDDAIRQMARELRSLLTQ